MRQRTQKQWGLYMTIENNPNIIKVTGTVREANGRTFMGHSGLDVIDDIWHYADVIIENADGELLKFQRVTSRRAGREPRCFRRSNMGARAGAGR